MGQMTPSQARIVDPVLSTIARGYQNQGMVASFLFPQVPVNLRGGKIIAFGKEGFMLYATQRAPGEDTKRVTFGYSGESYALADYSLEGQVPVEIEEEAQRGPGIDMGSHAVNTVQDIMALRLEYQAAQIARAAASYDANHKLALAGADKWTDPASDPIDDVSAARENVRASIGKYPNTLILGAKVFAGLKKNQKILDRIKYTGRDVPTLELLASLFEVKRVVVGEAVYADDAGNFADVWGGDAVLGYTEIGSKSNALPSYGYTYNLNGYPIVEQAYYDRRAKSWIYPVTRAEAPVLASAVAGFLFKDAA